MVIAQLETGSISKTPGLVRGHNTPEPTNIFNMTTATARHDHPRAGTGQSPRYVAAAAEYSGIDGLFLDHGLEGTVGGNSKESRANELARYLIANPDAQNDYGENLSDTVITGLNDEMVRAHTSYNNEFEYDRFKESYPALNRALERDGFTVEDGALRRTLPDALETSPS